MKSEGKTNRFPVARGVSKESPALVPCRWSPLLHFAKHGPRSRYTVVKASVYDLSLIHI